MTGPALPLRPLVLPRPLPTEGPLVSVLLPLYNYRQYIEEALTSVIEQSYRSIEVLVIDDFSTDGSWELACSVAERDSRISVHRNPNNCGASETYLRLLDLASGPLVKDFSADDRLYGAESLARLVAAIESEPGITLATGWRDLIDEDGVPLEESRQEPRYFDCDVVMDGVFLGDLALTQGRNVVGEIQVLFRREAFSKQDLREIGGVDPGPLFWGSDIVPWLNILSRGKAAYLNDTLAQLRIHSTGQLSRGIRRNPLWPEGWYSMMQGARNIGYLSGGSSYHKALLALLGAELGDIDGFVEGSEGEWDRCGDFLHRLLDEIIEV